MNEIIQIENEAIDKQDLKKVTIGVIDFFTYSDKGIAMLEGWKRQNDMRVEWDKERRKNFGDSA